MKLILATNNQHKLTEFRRVLDPLGVTVISQNEAGISIDVEETGKTFEENAKLKADAIYQLTGLPTVADDSGLEVDILDNAPGVYTARYAGENATDADRYNKLLGEMKAVKDADRTARFVCVLPESPRNSEIPQTQWTRGIFVYARKSRKVLVYLPLPNARR